MNKTYSPALHSKSRGAYQRVRKKQKQDLFDPKEFRKWVRWGREHANDKPFGKDWQKKIHYHK